jgi:hypothetical protein
MNYFFIQIIFSILASKEKEYETCSPPPAFFKTYSVLKIISFLFFSVPIFSQQSTNCVDAIQFAQGNNQCLSAKQINGNDIGYSFIADSTQIKIDITSLSGTANGHIYRAILYNGCFNASQITNDYMYGQDDNSLALYAFGLTIGSTYYLRLLTNYDTTQNCNNCAVKTGTYNICVQNISRGYQILNSPCSETCVTNIAINGDFEQGNTGVLSSAIFFPTCTQGMGVGKYGICNNANNLNGNWNEPAFQGNLSLFVDDREDPNNTIGSLWTQVFTVTPNKFYDISGWFSSLPSSDFKVDPNVKMVILGNQTGNQSIGSTGTINETDPWKQIRHCWYSNNNTQATLFIFSSPNGTASNGNDVGIDDIKFIVTDNFTIPGPVITSNPPNFFACPNQPITLTATTPYNDLGYIWSTGATTQSITVTPTSQTTYLVSIFETVCGASLPTNVTVNVAVPPDFTFIGSCQNALFNFTNTTNTFSNPATYSWNFGDPASGANNTSTQTSPSHLFSTHGSFTVSLTVNYACGSLTTIKIVNVIPSYTNYNANCCSNLITYTIDQLTNPNQLIIGSNTTWSGVNYTVRGTVQVQTGVTLTVNNQSNIDFDPNSKIIVQQGGTLIVDNATLRGLNQCGTMWQGIEVRGNNNFNQTALTQAGNLYQGKCVLKNNATIFNAHQAVVLGQPNGTGYVIAASGGIVDATNCNIMNCAYGIKIFPYKFVNTSKIQSSLMFGPNIIDPGYNSANPNYTYPNTNNPTYALANSLQRAHIHIYSLGTRRLRVMDNQIKQAQFGVFSLNSANWYIDGNADQSANSFSDLRTAIYATYWNSTIFGNRIEFNNITNNGLGNRWIELLGAKGDVIIRNRVGDLTNNNTSSQYFAQGLGLNNCSFYNIVDNEFNNMIAGIWNINGSGTIGYELSGNNFKFCNIGLRIEGQNPALKIKCNNHTNNPTLNPNLNYFLDWQLPNANTTLANQGAFTDLTTRGPAGNEFNQFMNLQNQYNEIWSQAALFNYYHHDPANGLSVKPGLSPFSGQVLTPANLSQLNGVFKNSNVSCTPAPCPPPCNGRIAQLTNTINNLQNELLNITNNLDGGQTANLIAAINSNMNGGQLKNLLLANSPLSDAVITAYINKNGTPPGLFKDVLIENSPVSNTVRPVLYQKISNMPSGIAAQIKNAQLFSAKRTITKITNEIESASIEKQFLENEAVKYYADNDQLNDAIVFLENTGTSYANQTIIATHLFNEDYTLAESKLNTFVPGNISEQLFKDLNMVLNTIGKTNRTIFELTPQDKTIIENIANSPLNCLARTNARAILTAVFNTMYDDEFVEPQINNRIIQTSPDAPLSFKDDYKYLGKSYPNPASNTLYTPYYLPDNETGKIIITDAMGKTVAEYYLPEGANTLEVNTNNLSAGLYNYCIYINNESTENRKMAIVK